MAHGSASKGHLDIDCYGQYVCSGRCEVVGKSQNKRPNSSESAHLFNNVQWNIDQSVTYQLLGNFLKWKFNFSIQDVRVCKGRAFNIYWSQNLQNWLMGFYNWEGVFTARHGLNNLNQFNYLWALQTFYM